MREEKARSFITIMIVIAVSALVLRFAAEKLIKINITQNESYASSTLKLISTALENYSRDNHGMYPTDFSLLTQAKPAYLDRDYTLIRSKGYILSCPRLEQGGYTCYAMPSSCHFSASMVYTITTGGLLISEGCDKKE